VSHASGRIKICNRKEVVPEWLLTQVIVMDAGHIGMLETIVTMLSIIMKVRVYVLAYPVLLNQCVIKIVLLFLNGQILRGLRRLYKNPYILWRCQMPMSPRYNENREYENLINEIRVEQGYTLRELASLIDITQGHMWSISQGYIGPYRGGTGKLKEWAKKLQEVFDYHLSEIFPREVCSLQTSNLTNDQIADIAHGYNSHWYKDNNVKTERMAWSFMVREAFENCLDERQVSVLKLRFLEDKTLKETGEIWGVQQERIRQIEAGALRLIRGYVSRTLKWDNWRLDYLYS